MVNIPPRLNNVATLRCVWYIVNYNTCFRLFPFFWH